MLHLNLGLLYLSPINAIQCDTEETKKFFIA
jgi:hypothetical protein